jgi:hypothetical protein
MLGYKVKEIQKEDNFNSVVAESGVFLPANENLIRKPETKKKKKIK